MSVNSLKLKCYQPFSRLNMQLFTNFSTAICKHRFLEAIWFVELASQKLHCTKLATLLYRKHHTCNYYKIELHCSK